MKPYNDFLSDFNMPEGGKSSCFDMSLTEARPIGWCETPQGFMLIAECPHCFTKFRFHISTVDRYEVDGFYRDFALYVSTYNEHQKE